MEAYLIIITKDNPILNYNVDNMIFHEEFTLIDENHLSINNEIYEFTYLIYSNEIKVNYQNNFLVMEDKKPVTNFFHQTSIENIIYLTNEENLSDEINMLIEEL